MNNFFVTLSFCFLMVNTFGQAKNKCTYTYFKNGKKSTSKCYEEDHQKGKAIVYDRKGNIIGEWDLSHMHIYTSVSFTFHENGMVKNVKFSSHPDGGIQWYESVTTYDENGNKVGFSETSNDDRKMIAPVKTEKEFKKTKDTLKNNSAKKDSIRQEEMQCAVIYVSELWFSNNTGKDILVRWKKNTGDPDEKEAETKIRKGEKIKITEQIQAQFYEDMYKAVTFSVYKPNGKKKIKSVISDTPLIDESRLNEFRKGYVYEIKKG